MKALFYEVAFFGSVFATACWASAYSTAFSKIRELTAKSTNKKHKEKANELLKTAIVKGLVGTLVLFWSSIEFGLMAKNTSRLFGSYILNDTVTSHISGVLMVVTLIAVIVMGITGLHDYLVLEVMRKNEGIKRANKPFHR